MQRSGPSLFGHDIFYTTINLGGRVLSGENGAAIVVCCGVLFNSFDEAFFGAAAAQQTESGLAAI